MGNRLVQESSPYLLQHAGNPVDWHPWGPEALERARREDRPILLSIGYSACHWCHVMERESFEDPAVAALMNEAFVNIKVDREERPDVDQIYMKAVQAMTGGGGWPLTVFLTPLQEPYYGGTYFPPEPRHGLPSFKQVLAAAANAYRERPADVQKAATQLVAALRAAPAEAGEGDDPGTRLLDHAASVFERQYDPMHGGFGRAPKFPQPVTMEFLFRHHLRTGQPRALEMAVHTLRQMAAGGLRDHLGGGFHRYSVDARWLVPHFEKMLYDNALLARAYTDGYRVAGDEELAEVARSTLDYLLADLHAPDGGFYAARDADSEGEEGRFYVWTPSQVRDVLGDDAALFLRAYDVTEAGNFEGTNILHLPHPLPALAAAQEMEEELLVERLSSARRRLLEARSGRVPPALDDKVLLSWNGMTLRALAEGGRVLRRPDYLVEARRTAAFLWEAFLVEGRLRHSWKDGTARVDGFLEDYGALGNGLLSLYEATSDAAWLEPVRFCCDRILELFWDDGEGRFYDTPVDGEALVVRPRDPMDNATPSGTSLAAELLTRAGHLFDEERYGAVAGRAVAAEAGVLERYPPAFGRLLSVLDRRLTPPTEVVVVGRRDEEGTEALLDAAHASFGRNRTVAGGSGDGAPSLPLLTGRGTVDGTPAAYVCRSYSCLAPVTTAEAVEEALAEAERADAGGG